ncbi:26413_t:CDS:2 [Dentiscutata erythropus]|uniref:26413_t:CDS:1 n=1 Tax=Dentiscutata erythropus TaxID=1348616 RepID=A0A9N8ZIA8_9GLOM|nr:26413_t:CDS:2 [Dentiscutata erythropus]
MELIEEELGIEYEKNTEDKPDRAGIKLEKDINIVSKSDNASENTNNYQYGQLDPCKTTWAKAFTEVVDNKLIEFEYNFYQIHFDELLEGINYFLVAESEKAYFHISFILKHWYKNEFINAVAVDKLFLRRKLLEKNSSTLSLFSFLDVANLWNTILNEASIQAVAKAIGCKQSIKQTLLGLVCKYIEVVNYDDLNNLKILIKIKK